MARLSNMPSQAIVDGFKGVVDFYVYKDTAVARKWPRWHTRESYPAEAANQADFAYVNKLAGSLPEYLINQYKRMAAGTPFSWKDLLVRAYMKGLDY